MGGLNLKILNPQTPSELVGNEAFGGGWPCCPDRRDEGHSGDEELVAKSSSSYTRD